MGITTLTRLFVCGVVYTRLKKYILYNNDTFMLNNHVYNLLLQATEEHKSLWRIKDEYKKNAADCTECQNFWATLEKDKEQHVQDLEVLIKKHL